MGELDGMDGGYIKGLPAGIDLEKIEFAKAKGCHLYDGNGREYLDMSAGLTVPFGHCNQSIIDAASACATTIDNCEDYSSPSRRELIERIQLLLPDLAGGVQLYSAGTEAVEAALRFARQITGKDGVLSFYGSYHGKTKGSVSAGNSAAYNGPRISGYLKVPFADCSVCWGEDTNVTCERGCGRQIRRLVAENIDRNLGAIIVEPVQGSGGIKVAPLRFLTFLRELADEYHAVTIYDEIFCGMGRAGRMFAYQRLGALDPDILTIGKALGSGYPISAAVVARRHLAAVHRIEGGTSYGGNPISCAAAVETLRLFATTTWKLSVERLESALHSGLASISQYPIVDRCSVFGVMAAMQFAGPPNNTFINRIYRMCLTEGLLITPGEDFICLTPPLTMTVGEAAIGIEILERAIRRCI